MTRAIEEDRAKQTAQAQSAATDMRSAERSEALHKEFSKSEKSPLDPELEFTVRDLEITNRMKDRYIERLEADRVRFDAERLALTQSRNLRPYVSRCRFAFAAALERTVCHLRLFSRPFFLFC